MPHCLPLDSRLQHTQVEPSPRAYNPWGSKELLGHEGVRFASLCLVGVIKTKVMTTLAGFMGILQNYCYLFYWCLGSVQLQKYFAAYISTPKYGQDLGEPGMGLSSIEGGKAQRGPRVLHRQREMHKCGFSHFSLSAQFMSLTAIGISFEVSSARHLDLARLTPLRALFLTGSRRSAVGWSGGGLLALAGVAGFSRVIAPSVNVATRLFPHWASQIASILTEACHK